MVEVTDRIWLTGSTGLLGSYIARYLLKSGYTNLVCNKRATSDLSLISDFSEDVTWVDIDLTSYYDVYDFMKEVDCVIHAAAMVSFNPQDKSQLEENNVEVTTTIVNAALEENIKKLVYISSVAALGKRADGKRISETQEWKESSLNSHYGISKYKSELEVWRGGQEGLDMVILSPAYILGTGKWGSSSLRLYPDVAKGNRYYPEGGNGFVDVRDVAEAVIKVIEQDRTQENYIISAEDLSYFEVMKVMCQTLDLDPPSKGLTSYHRKVYYYMRRIKDLVSLKSPSLTMSALNNLSIQSCYNNQKSIDELSMNYRDIRKTLRETTSRFKAKDESPLPIAFRG